MAYPDDEVRNLPLATTIPPPEARGRTQAVNDPNSAAFQHPSVRTVVPPLAVAAPAVPTSSLPLNQRPQVLDASAPQRVISAIKPAGAEALPQAAEPLAAPSGVRPVAVRNVPLGPIGDMSRRVSGDEALGAARIIGANSLPPGSAPQRVQLASQPGLLSTLSDKIAKAYQGSDTQAVIEGGHMAQSDALARGDTSGAVGHLARTALTVPLAFASDVAGAVARPTGSIIAPVGNAIRTFATGESGAQASPANAGAVTPAGPIAKRAGAGSGEAFESGFPTPATPATPATPGAASSVEGAPGVQKTVDAQGRTTYTDGANTPQAGGPISARNMQAADALDARQRAESAALLARAEPTGPSVTILPDSGNAAQGATGIQNTQPTFDTRGLSRREIARLAVSQSNNRESNDTSRANNAGSNATTERGQDIGATTQRQGQVLTNLAERERSRIAGAQAGASIEHSQAQTASLKAVTDAQNEYRAAVASGDAKRMVKAEDALRAVQGRYEKPDQFSVVPIPGGIDPATGMSRGAGAIVVNRASGETKILSPDEARGKQPPQYEAGKTYRDKNGNTAKWDGSNFVPVQ